MDTLRSLPRVDVALVAGPDPGHAFPVIAVACALRDRGHEVLVATGDRWADDLAREHVRFAPLPLLDSSPDDGDIGHLLWTRGARMATPLAETLSDFAPDVVVADTLTTPGALAAELLGVPWVEVSPHFLYDPDPRVPPVGLGADPPRGPFGRANQASIRRQQERSLAVGSAQRDAARRGLGLVGSGGPAARLLATLPELEPLRARWPRATFVVGALPWEPPTWPSLEPPPGEAPLVLVSDSTASGVRRSLAEVALGWLRDDASVRAVVTTGRQDLTDAPGVVVGRGRHAPLLEHADLVVATAGHGLVTKALTSGVPLVLAPLHGDQRETAARVRRAGLGIALDRRWPTAADVQRAARRVLADRVVRDRARGVAARTGRLGPTRAAAVIERVVATRR